MPIPHHLTRTIFLSLTQFRHIDRCHGFIWHTFFINNWHIFSLFCLWTTGPSWSPLSIFFISTEMLFSTVYRSPHLKWHSHGYKFSFNDIENPFGANMSEAIGGKVIGTAKKKKKNKTKVCIEKSETSEIWLRWKMVFGSDGEGESLTSFDGYCHCHTLTHNAHTFFRHKRFPSVKLIKVIASIIHPIASSPSLSRTHTHTLTLSLDL